MADLTDSFLGSKQNKNKQKNYIIAGVPLAGKSTLSHHLHKKYSLNHIPTDGFVTAFEEVLPKVGITHGFGLTKKGYATVCKKNTAFLISFINELEDQNKYGNYVIEGCHWKLEELTQFKDTHTIIVLGYPSVRCEDKFQLVRAVDKDNWTNELLDNELKKIIQFWIDMSIDLQKQSKKLNFEFIDTGYNYEKLFEL